jgi:putative transcriptional regulator
MQPMPHPKADNFRRNLAIACSEHGRIQNVADDAGVSRVYLSRIIHGKSVPTLEVAARIADALGIPLSDLLEKKSRNLRPVA